MKIRTRLTGDLCEITVRMQHPMETGLRKDASGKLVPVHHIQIIAVSLNNKVIVTGQTGPSVSRNPTFAFRVRGAKSGDKISVNWKDNKGEARTDEVTIA